MKFRIFNKTDYKSYDYDDNKNDVCIMEDGFVYELIPCTLFGEPFIDYSKRTDLDFEIIKTNSRFN